MEDSYITESPWYQMIFNRGKEAGFLKSAKEQGFTQGFAQGIIKGMRRASRIMLEHRFGVLDGDLLAALDVADETKLDEITEHFVSDSLPELRARLGLA